MVRRSNCVNNEAILRAQLKYKDSFLEYEKTMQASENDQKYVDECMKNEGYTGHFFCIRYPDLEKTYIVFEGMPSNDPMLYGYIATTVSDSERKRLLGLLPNYWFMSNDIDENKIPSKEELAKMVQKFYEYWFDMIRIDEFKFQDILYPKNKEVNNSVKTT